MNRTGIKDVATTSRNPQANAICKRMVHQTVGNVLRTLLHGHTPKDDLEAEAIVDNALATTTHVLRSTATRSLSFQSPGSIAFHRDMFLNIPFLADLEALRQKRQLIIDENLRKANARRRQYDYRIGDSVHIKTVDPTKLQARSHGPYPIVRVHANGTLTLQVAPHITERINLRRVYPHRVQQA